MPLEDITLAVFAACNSFRVVAYVPQILKAAGDRNGASSISLMTWFLFLIAHPSTAAYALINRSDWGLAGAWATLGLVPATTTSFGFSLRSGSRSRLPATASAHLSCL
jgi:hypothetical protein